MDPSPSKCCCGNNISSTPIQPKKAFASIETRTSESNSEEEMHRNDGIPMNSIAASSSQCTRQSSPPSSLKPPPRILLDESDDNFSWVPQQPVTSTTTFSPKKTQHHSNSTAHPTSPTSTTTTNTIPNSNLSPLKLSNQKHKSQNNVMTTNCSSSSYHHTSILNTTLSNDISARMNEKTTTNNNNTDGTITHPSHIPRSPASKEKRRKIKSAPASVKRNSGNERNSSRGIFSAIKELLTMCKGRSNHVQPNNSSMIEGDTTMTSEPKETSHDTNNDKKEDSVNNTNQHTQTVPANHRTDSSSGLFHRTESNHSGDSSVVQLHDSSMNPFEKQSEKTEVEVFDSNQPPSSPSKVNNRKARCGAHASSSDFIRSSAQPVPLYFFVLNGQQQQQQPQGSSSSFSPKKAIADNLLYDLTPPTTTGTTNETTE